MLLIIKKICFITLLTLAVVPLYAQESLSTADQEKEYKVKAAFVYNFMKFVEWSSMEMGEGFKSSDDMVLSVVGDNPFGRSLDALETKSINDKKISISYFEYSQLFNQESLAKLRESHVLFVCQSEKEHYSEILGYFEGKCILTIGDEREFAAGSGMISFGIERGKICFDINFNNAKESGVKISAKLLKLARKVYKD